jgi:hypothetical protein
MDSVGTLEKLIHGDLGLGPPFLDASAHKMLYLVPYYFARMAVRSEAIGLGPDRITANSARRRLRLVP